MPFAHCQGASPPARVMIEFMPALPHNRGSTKSAGFPPAGPYKRRMKMKTLLRAVLLLVAFALSVVP